MTTALMHPLGLAALKAREGCRLAAYRDSVGVWTIGVGHTKGVTPGQTITAAQADALFLDDLAAHALPILSCIRVPVADHERDALISIAFNIGVAGFRGSTFLRKLNAGDRDACAAAILSWSKPAAILTRRIAEHDQFRTPYAVAAPKARSTDAHAVGVPLAPEAVVILPVPVPPHPDAPVTAPEGLFARIAARLRAAYPPKEV